MSIRNPQRGVDGALVLSLGFRGEVLARARNSGHGEWEREWPWALSAQEFKRCWERRGVAGRVGEYER